jgi:hypothetical protein
MPQFIVGAETSFVDYDERDFPLPTWYYIDTRSEVYGDGWANEFDSTLNPSLATKYSTYEEAKLWNDEFLNGEGIIFAVAGKIKKRV